MVSAGAQFALAQGLGSGPLYCPPLGKGVASWPPGTTPNRASCTQLPPPASPCQRGGHGRVPLPVPRALERCP